MHFSLTTNAVTVFAALAGYVAAVSSTHCDGGSLDLSRWSLQLPIGTKGHPTTISSSKLCDGYSDKNYFYFGSDNALIMKVPGSPKTTNCVTTPNSNHCRTELHESNPTTWSPSSAVNRLFADLKVTETHGEITIGQIKIDDAISTKPAAELYYTADGTIKIGYPTCLTCSQQRIDIGKVPIGQRFTYEIRYEKGKMSVSINGKGFKELPTQNLKGPKSYFKAGNYNGSDKPTEVHFYKIETTHS